MMNPKLPEAVKIYKALGWENVTPENVLMLSTGTSEQKKIALEGLQSGEWGELVSVEAGLLRWRNYCDADSNKLLLFAIRAGLSARRAAGRLGTGNAWMLAAVIGARGAKYAAEVISLACRSDGRLWEHSASWFGNAAVRLVASLDMELPQNVEYMKDWAVYAAHAMGLKAETRFGETSLPGLDMIEPRFAEHVTAGVAIGTPATGSFGAVLPEGVKRGWLTRETAVGLVFAALESAVRPGDRKVWLGALDALGIRDDELAERTQLLIPLLSSGDNAVAARLAPVLITRADDLQLTEVIIAALSADTKKSRRMVLKTAMERKRPINAEDLTPWLSILAADADKAIAALALKLAERWELAAEAPPEDNAEIRGLWHAAPPVWQVPPFELGEVSPESLTELAAEMTGRRVHVYDITTERFLAAANAVAYQNPGDARMSLRGLRPGDSTLLYYIICWVKGEKPVVGHDKEHKPIYEIGESFHPPLRGRDYRVCLLLDSLPCILSTPSKLDLSVTVPDLASRLALYEKTGTDAVEEDLFLALTRLDAKTQTPEALDALRRLNVPVVLQTGAKMPVTAGQAALWYLEHPLTEPPVSGRNVAYWYKIGIDISAALPHFSNRFQNHVIEPYSIFPLWGDVTLGAIRWNYGEVNHELGLVLRQAARRAVPFSPGVSMNLFAAQRSMSPDAAGDCMHAVIEAWERGLLRPGVADVSLTDWSDDPPSNLAALAAVLDGFAQDGLLSVVWPISDALIDTSLKAPRLLAGTAELAELIILYLPEVLHAVEQGTANADTLALPGIRALAECGGKSRAVTAAKQAVELLPAVSAPAPLPKSTKELDPPFDKVWREYKNPPPIEDGVIVTVDSYNLTATTKGFLFKLTLPDVSDRVFHVVKGWYYDLENEGQCQAYAAAPGTASFSRENEVWLYWDEEAKRMMVSEYRNRVSGSRGPLGGVKTPPLPASLLTVIIGLLAQDGDAAYYAPRLVQNFISNGQIGAEMARMAVRTLLQNPAVSPAKLVRGLEKDVDLLPVLYPVLIECVKLAGTSSVDKPPVWVNRILDVALRYAPYLSEAAKRGLIPTKDARWTGLCEIASSKGKSTAVVKAKKLIEELK